jgi:hypothetical protein
LTPMKSVLPGGSIATGTGDAALACGVAEGAAACSGEGARRGVCAGPGGDSELVALMGGASTGLPANLGSIVSGRRFNPSMVSPARFSAGCQRYDNVIVVDTINLCNTNRAPH